MYFDPRTLPDPRFGPLGKSALYSQYEGSGGIKVTVADKGGDSVLKEPKY